MKTSRLALIAVLAAACSSPPEPEALTDAAPADSPDARPDGPPADAPIDAPDAGPTGSPNLHLDGTIAFGAISLGAMSSQTFTLSNHGSAASAAIAIAVDPGPFALDSDDCSTHALAIDAQCTFAVTFTPTAAGDLGAMLHVTSGAAPSIDRMLTGHGNLPATLTVTPSAATDFGSIRQGQATTATTLTARNDGEEATPALVIALGNSIDFALVDGKPCAGQPIAAHSTCDFGVRFQPTTAGPASATVHVSAGALAATHDVGGTGLAPGAIDIVEASHDFGSVRVDAGAVTHTFVVTNTGQVAIAAPTVSIAGTGAAAYTETTDCAGSLTAADTCSVTVSFDPGAIGPAAASLKVDSTDGGSDGAGLSGTGTVHVVVARTGLGTVTSSQPGITCGATCAADFSSTPLTLDATADATTDFGGWTGCDHTSATSCSLNLTAAKNVSVTFTTKQRTLTVYLHGTGGGAITVNSAPLTCTTAMCTGTYATGAALAISAAPDASSTFTSLTGATCSTSPCSLTINADVSLDATFTRKQYTVTTIAKPAAGGTVAGGGTYDVGSNVTLTATPATDYDFQSWTGCSSTTATCTITGLAANATVTANFVLHQYTITTTASPTAGGTIAGGGTYDAGSNVTLTATPAADYDFQSWTGCTSSTATCTLSNVHANASITATFALHQFTVTTTASPTAGGTIAGGGTYGAGANVTLTATPALGYAFSSWTGCASSTATCTISNLHANTGVTATFVLQKYTVTTTASPTAGGTIAGGGTYDAGSNVTLTATPATGYAFSSWTGCTSSTATCTISNLQANASVTATFTLQQFTVTTTASPVAGGTVSGGGAYTAGSNVTLTATPATNYDFSSWTGCTSSTTTCTLTNLQASASVTATFTLHQYTVTTTASPSAGGTVSGGGTYGAGSNVTLTATPSASYDFSSWTGCTSSTATCTITNLGANKSVTAHFTLKQYTVTTNANPTAGGTVSGGGTYDIGSNVTLTATPAANYGFSSWTGCTSSTATCTITNLTANKSVTASFAIKQYTVSATITPTGGGTVNGTGTYNAGSTVTLNSVPAAGYVFGSWTGCTSSTGATCTITNLQASATVTATFTPQYTITANVAPAASGSVSGAGTFSAGTNHTLTATPAAGYAFSSWTSCPSASGATCTINNLSSNVTVTATFVAQYTISATIVPAGTGSVSGTGTFAAGTAHTLTATPATGYGFVSWASCPAPSGATCSIASLSGNVSVNANFAPMYTVSVTNTPSGAGSVSGAGTFVAGSTVTLTATAVTPWAFNFWSNCPSANGATCTITNLQASTTVTANYRSTLSWGVSFGGDGSGSVSGSVSCGTGSSCAQTGVAPGTTITEVATAASGSVFDHWTGACAGQGATCSFALTTSTSATAYFYRSTYDLTISSTYISCVSGCSGDGTYPAGTAMDLFGQKTAVLGPPTNRQLCYYDVKTWSGCDSSSGDDCMLTLDGDRTVSATFFTTPSMCESLSP